MAKLDARPSARKSVELIDAISCDAKGRSGNCNRFVGILQKMQPFLKWILERQKPQACPLLVHSVLLIRFALQSLKGAFREIADEDLRSTSDAELQSKVEAVSGDLARALEQIPFNQMAVPSNIKSDIQKIVEEIHYTSYEKTVSGPHSAQGQYESSNIYCRETIDFLNSLGDDQPQPCPRDCPDSAVSMSPPEEFLCPISGKLMEDPVIMFQSGITYDRKEIENWFIANNKSRKLEDNVGLIAIEKQIAPNMVLRQQVTEWRRARNLPIPGIKDRMYDEFFAKRGVIWPSSKNVECIGTDGRTKVVRRPSHLITTLWTSIPLPPPSPPSPPSESPSPAPVRERLASAREVELRDFRRPGPEEIQEMRECELARWRKRNLSKMFLDVALFPVRFSLTVVVWLPLYSGSSLLDLLSSAAFKDGRLPRWVRKCVRWVDQIFDWIWPLEELRQPVDSFEYYPLI